MANVLWEVHGTGWEVHGGLNLRSALGGYSTLGSTWQNLLSPRWNYDHLPYEPPYNGVNVLNGGLRASGAILLNQYLFQQLRTIDRTSSSISGSENSAVNSNRMVWCSLRMRASNWSSAASTGGSNWRVRSNSDPSRFEQCEPKANSFHKRSKLDMQLETCDYEKNLKILPDHHL